MEKQFSLDAESAADLLEDMAESIRDNEIAFDGGEWKVYQPFTQIFMLMYKEDNELEISFKFKDEDSN
jgi:amphi-Trp domain-containing protein